MTLRSSRLVSAMAVAALACVSKAQWRVIEEPQRAGFQPAAIDGGTIVASGWGASLGSVWTAGWPNYDALDAEGLSTWTIPAGVDGGRVGGYARVGNAWHAALWTARNWNQPGWSTAPFASWVYTPLHPTGATNSYVYAVSGTTQGGVAQFGSIMQAGIWSGTASSWTSLHPTAAGVQGSYIAGMLGSQQGGAVLINSGGAFPTYRAAIWSGTPGSWIDLHPVGAYESRIYGVGPGEQVGHIKWTDQQPLQAALWSGSSASVRSLHPAGATTSSARSTNGQHQVGFFGTTGFRACLWRGTADTHVDLHALIPALGQWDTSQAVSVSTSGGFTRVVGWVQRGSTVYPVMWTDEPELKKQWRATTLPVAAGSQIPLAASGSKLAGLRDVGPWSVAQLWDTQQRTSLVLQPSFDVPLYEGIEGSAAFGTDSQQQVGYVSVVQRPYGSPVGIRNAWVWNSSPSSWINLHPAGALFEPSEAYAIRGGQQVGHVNNRAALWSGTSASYVNLHPPSAPPGSASAALATTGQQQVGYYYSGTEYVVGDAALWTGSAASLINLAHPAWSSLSQYGVGSRALATNGSQQGGWWGVIEDGDSRSPVAVLWSGTGASAISMQPLGTTYSKILGMDEQHQVGLIGSPNGSGQARAAFWSGTPGSAINLHQLLPDYFTDSSATCITTNDGVLTVAGWARDSYSRTKPVVWTQEPSPEPAAWALKSPAARPSPRNGHAMAYDSARGVTVMFGGSGGSPREYKNETWEWDGTNWTQRALTGPRPTRRDGHKMAYDASRGVTVLFGGQTGSYASSTLSGETWEWNGTAWSQRLISGPSPRHDAAMAYDARRQRIVLFGGNNGPTIFNETWELDASGWRLVATGDPSTRYAFPMAYDSWRGAVVMHGGRASAAVQLLDDTWSFAGGSSWASDDFLPTPVSARYYHSMHDDPIARSVCIYGGYSGTALGGGGPGETSGELWFFNGVSWYREQPAGPNPGARYAHAMVFDAARAEAVLFGGSDASGAFRDDTWTLKRPCTSVRAPVSRAVLAFDPVSFSTGLPSGVNGTYQWRRNGEIIDPQSNPSAATATLNINSVRTTDAGTYDCIVSATCGTVTSSGATLTVQARCGLSDVAGPGQVITPDGQLTADDIIVFVNLFFMGDPRSDIASGGQILTPDGQFTADDLIVFINRFFAGC
jgi:hypothetical protein